MLLEVKKVDALKRELMFEVGKDRVAKELEEIYKEISKYAKVKGFRPGKVPRHILEASHSQVAQEEVIKKIIPEVYREAIEKEKLEPIDLPEIEDVNLKDGILKFKAVLDIKPEIKLGNYKGIKVTKKANEVTEEEINKTLEIFKQGQGKDKEVVFDDAFAKGLGYSTFEEFKNALKRQLEFDKERTNRLDLENQIIDEILKQAKFTVPQSLVKRQLERRVHETKHRLKQQGLKDEDIKAKDEDIRKDLHDAVEKDVKVYLVFDKIAELEKITGNQNESMPAKVMEFLLKEAKWQ